MSFLMSAVTRIHYDMIRLQHYTLSLKSKLPSSHWHGLSQRCKGKLPLRLRSSVRVELSWCGQIFRPKTLRLGYRHVIRRRRTSNRRRRINHAMRICPTDRCKSPIRRRSDRRRCARSRTICPTLRIHDRSSRSIIRSRGKH